MRVTTFDIAEEITIRCPSCRSDVVESTFNDDTIVDVIDSDSGEITHELQVYKCVDGECGIIFCM